MKKNGLIKYFFSCGAIIYTVGSALILIISLLVSESKSVTLLAPKPFLFYLGFSYVISLGNTVFKIENIFSPIRRLIHALAYILGAFALVLLCGMKFAYCAIVAAIVGIFYAITVFFIALINGRVGRLSPSAASTAKPDKKADNNKKQKNAPQKEEYKSRFS